MEAVEAGNFTFLFANVGSTRLWQQLPEAMQQAHVIYEAAIRRAIEEQGGHLFQVVSGDFYAAFTEASAAIAAAVAIQQAISAAVWPAAIDKLQVRVALHSGPAEVRDDNYQASPTLNRLSRILAASHAGQMLISDVTAQLAGSPPAANVQLRDFGERRLRDVPQSMRLYQLLAPNLPTDFPPLKTLDRRPNNLPAPPTSFIGRESDVAAVATLLRSPAVRLVTLSGFGGSGKTRLSLEVAADLLDEYEHGVFFVPLAPISDPTMVISTIAHTLGLQEHGGEVVGETLKQYLRDKQMLLVLDNFEQVVAAAPLISDLLAAAPQLKALVSSRERLGIADEFDYAVTPLALPDLDHPPSLAELSACPVIKLFVQRAQAVKFDFALTAANAADVAAICVRLDGLPLAIELAAAHSNTLDPSQILTQLRDRLSLLVVGWRNLPARQRSLRGAIEWSYDLLTPPQKLLFRRLAVFVGGWDEPAARQVCSGEGITEQEVAQLLAQLADKSLIQTQAQGEAMRYMMLETIREYALRVVAEVQTEITRYTMGQEIQEYAHEQLAISGTLATLRQRHADYYLALAEQAHPFLSTSAQATWLARLEMEKNNINAALTWVWERQQTEPLLRLVVAVWPFWHMRGYLHEGRNWLEIAAAMSAGQVSWLRAKALNAATAIANIQGDTGAAAKFGAESLAIARQLDDRPSIAAVLNTMGTIAIGVGNYAQAREILTEALAIERELGNQSRSAVIASNLAVAAEEMGDLQSATTIYQETLAIYRELGNQRVIALVLSNLGNISIKQGYIAAAREYLIEAKRVSEEGGSKDGNGEIIGNLGRLAELDGDFDLAQAMYEQSLAMYEEVDDHQGVASQLPNLANLARKQGNFAHAHEMYRRSMAVMIEDNFRGEIPRLLEGLAQLAADEGQPAQAARLLGAAAAWRMAIAKPLAGVEVEPVAALTEQLTAQLGAGFATLFDEGGAMSEEQAIQYALDWVSQR